MSQKISSALAHPNIAFIKYWGNANPSLRLPSNGSISMNLEGLETVTSLSSSTQQNTHTLIINDVVQESVKSSRIAEYLEKIRTLYPFEGFLTIRSRNNFPISAGIASSASAFAALALALNDFLALGLSEPEISALARLGSGSASRSIPGGYVQWEPGNDHQLSFAASIASPTHWQLFDVILAVTLDEKKISSTRGHQHADTSPYQSVRVHDTPRRLNICRQAIIDKDFEKLAWIIEQDSDMMHAVMLTSDPPIVYWQPASLSIMQTVRELRKNGVACAYTLDAGPNVHIICPPSSKDAVLDFFSEYPGIQEIYIAKTGGAAHIIPS